MLMQGSGLIDGRGEKWWNLSYKSHKVNIFLCLLLFYATPAGVQLLIFRFNRELMGQNSLDQVIVQW